MSSQPNEDEREVGDQPRFVDPIEWPNSLPLPQRPDEQRADSTSSSQSGSSPPVNSRSSVILDMILSTLDARVHGEHNQGQLHEGTSSLDSSPSDTEQRFTGAPITHSLQLPIALGGKLSERDTQLLPQPVRSPSRYEPETLTPIGSEAAPSVIGRADSILTTVYYSARTSLSIKLPSRASTILSVSRTRTSTTTPEITTSNTSLSGYQEAGPSTQADVILDQESCSWRSLDGPDGTHMSILEPEEYQGLHVEETDSSRVDQEHDWSLAVLPLLPEVQPFQGFGRSLRDSVILRQSMRAFPLDDRFQERMEDQLLRWTAPQSLFHMEEVLNGRHAYQRDDLPVHKIKSQGALTLFQNSSSTDGQLTDSTVESLVRSPFLERGVSNRVPPPSSSAFQEHNGDIDSALSSGLSATVPLQPSTLDAIEESDLNSIQESPPYLYRGGSPSITASIRRQLEGESPLERDDSQEPTTAMAELVVNDPPTAQAIPVTIEEVQMMVKYEPEEVPPMVLRRLDNEEYEDVEVNLLDGLEACGRDVLMLITCCHMCDCSEDPYDGYPLQSTLTLGSNTIPTHTSIAPSDRPARRAAQPSGTGTHLF